MCENFLVLEVQRFGFAAFCGYRCFGVSVEDAYDQFSVYCIVVKIQQVSHFICVSFEIIYSCRLI